MGRAVGWAAGIVGFIALAVIAGLVLFDWNLLRSPLAHWVTQETGRDFAIEGDLQGEFSLTPSLRARDIRLGNAEWADTPNMVEIAELAVHLDLRGLLRGHVVVSEVRVTGAQIHLETDAQGRANWDLEALPALPEERVEVPHLERLIIEDSRLTLRERVRDITFEATLAAAAVVSPEAGAYPVRLDGDGEIEGRAYSIRAGGAPLLMLRETDIPYPFEIEIDIEATSARLTGYLGTPLAFDGLDAEFHVTGPNPARLAPVLQIPLPSTRPYDLAGRLLRDGHHWRYEAFRGTVGDSDLAGTIDVETDRERPLITADLVSEALDIVDLIPVIGVPPPLVEDVPETLPERLLPDAPLQIEQLRAVDADVHFRGTRVIARALPFHDVELLLELEDGVLQLTPWRFGLAGGEFNLYASIYSGAVPVETDVDLRLTGLGLGPLLAGVAPEGAAQGTLNGRILFSSTGDTLRGALATADGEAALVMGRGRVSESVLALLDAGFLEALAVILANGEPQPMEIRCFLAAFDLRQGVMHTEVMILDTEDSIIAGEGTVDLGEETLDLRVSGEPKALEIAGARVPIEIGGRFSAPEVAIDPDGIAVRGVLGLALGALLAPLAAIVPLIELGLAEDGDCQELFEDIEMEVAPE